MADLASRFKIYRKKAKLTQLELADRSGVPYGTIKRFERTGKISLESLWRLDPPSDATDCWTFFSVPRRLRPTI